MARINWILTFNLSGSGLSENCVTHMFPPNTQAIGKYTAGYIHTVYVHYTGSLHDLRSQFLNSRLGKLTMYIITMIPMKRPY